MRWPCSRCAHVAGAAQAQAGADDDSADPPGRVARLAYVAGDLGFLPAGASEWVDAAINRPLTSGDRLATGRGRARRTGAGWRQSCAWPTVTERRRDCELDDRLAQMELTQGTLNLTVRRLDPGQSYEIDTPTLALVVDQPGSFRVDIDDRRARHRGHRVRRPGHRVRRKQRTANGQSRGRSYRFTDPALAGVTISHSDGGDAFDDWCSRARSPLCAIRPAASMYPTTWSATRISTSTAAGRTAGTTAQVWYPSQVGRRLGALQRRALGLYRPVGLELGRQCTVGLCALPLRPLGLYATWLGLDSRAERRAPGLCTGAGRLRRRRRLVDRHRRRPGGLVSAGTGRDLRPVVSLLAATTTPGSIVNIAATAATIRASWSITTTATVAASACRDEHYANRDAPHGFTAVPGRTFAAGRSVRHDRLRVDPHRLAQAPVLPRGTLARPDADGGQRARDPRRHAPPTGDFHRDVVARGDARTLDRNPDAPRRRSGQAGATPYARAWRRGR